MIISGIILGIALCVIWWYVANTRFKYSEIRLARVIANHEELFNPIIGAYYVADNIIVSTNKTKVTANLLVKNKIDNTVISSKLVNYQINNIDLCATCLLI